METCHPLEIEAKLFSKGAQEKQVQNENIATYCKTTSLVDHLRTRKGGWFHVEAENGRATITVHRPGRLDEVIFCLSPGHANQVRQALSDQGLAGLVEGAL